MKILRGAPKVLDSRKGGSGKNVGLGGVGWGGGLRKFVYFKVNRTGGWGS